MIDRAKLSGHFQLQSFPSYMCTRCAKGKFKPVGEVLFHHPQFSKEQYQQEWADVEQIELCSSFTVQCSEESCEQQASVYLTGHVIRVFDEEIHTEIFVEYFEIKSFYPAPLIIDVPNDCPEDVLTPLILASTNFWIDKGAALNSLRRSLENFVSFLGVPEYHEGKWVSLGNRLKQLKNEEAAEVIGLLKPIVNSGSHSGEVQLDTILDCFEAFELFLNIHFDSRAKKLEEIKDRLRKKEKE